MALNAKDTPIRIEVKVTGAERTSDAFKKARRQMYREVRRGLKSAGEETILPVARRLAAHSSPVNPNNVVVKTTAQYAYLTGKTKKSNRIIGFLNFGGSQPGAGDSNLPLLPRKKRALVVNGQPVANVKTRRRIKGKHFLEQARAAQFDNYADVLTKKFVMKTFDPLDHTP